MKIRAKMILSTAAVALSCALLAGCGGSSSSSAPAASSQAASSVASSAVSEAASATAEGTNGTDALDDAVNTLLDTNPISNQFEIAAMNIEYDFGIQADDITSYKGVKSNDNGDAGLVLVIQAAAGKAQNVVDALTTYQKDQVAFYGNYAEFAQAQSNVENAVIGSNDSDLVVMVIASNECSADLSSAVPSAASVFFITTKRRLTPWFSAPSCFCSGSSPSRWRCTISRRQSSKIPSCSCAASCFTAGARCAFSPS